MITADQAICIETTSLNYCWAVN